MIKYFKLSLYLYVLIGFSISKAGSFEDFFAALSSDNAKQVQALMDAGFDPNTINAAGQSGLIFAISKGAVNSALLLSQTKTLKADYRNDKDENALMLASLFGMKEVAEVLINRDSDINKPGWTPLHYAASRGQAPILRLLIDRHAYIDAASPNGTTPLMMAAMYGNDESVQLLLDSDADPTLKNALGLNALDFARQYGNETRAKLIADQVRSNTSNGSWTRKAN